MNKQLVNFDAKIGDVITLPTSGKKVIVTEIMNDDVLTVAKLEKERPDGGHVTFPMRYSVLWNIGAYYFSRRILEHESDDCIVTANMVTERGENEDQSSYGAVPLGVPYRNY